MLDDFLGSDSRGPRKAKENSGKERERKRAATSYFPSKFNVVKGNVACKKHTPLSQRKHAYG